MKQVLTMIKGHGQVKGGAEEKKIMRQEVNTL